MQIGALKRELKNIISIAYPVFFAQVVMILFPVVDSIMAAQLGESSLASLSLATSFWNPIFITLQGLLLGLLGLVSYERGRSNKIAIGEYFSSAIFIVICLILFGVALNMISTHALSTLNIDEQVKLHSSEYLFYVLFSLPAVLLFSLIRIFTESLTNSKYNIYIALFGLLINIPLNYILMHGQFGLPALGVAGCAIATTISFWLMFILQVILVLYGEELSEYKFYRYFHQLSWHRASDILKVGAPIAAAIFLEVALFTCIPILSAHSGVDLVASHQIAMNVMLIIYLLPLSLSIVATVRVGKLQGEKDFQQLTQFINIIFVTSITLAILISIFIFFEREQIASLYSTHSSIVIYTSNLLLILSLYHIPDAIQSISTGVLRGLNQTRSLFFVSLICYWLIGFTAGYHFSNKVASFIGPIGYWIGISVGLLLASLLLVIIMRKQLKLVLST